MPLNRHQYAGKMYHDLIVGLPGAKAALPAKPRIKAGHEEKDEMERLLAKLSKESSASKGESNPARKRVLFHPGTSRLALVKGLNKTWSAENWCKLAEILYKESKTNSDIDVILAGGPDDEDAIKQIRSLLKPDTRVLSTYGHTRSLKELVGLIDICDVTVCVDSAPMHLAIALNKPTVALFGPTNEAVLVPDAVEHFVVLRKETLDRAKDTAADNGNLASNSTDNLHPTMKQASFLYPGAPAVQLPAEIVAQSVLDLLKQAARPDGSPAVHAD
jgi:ADP-heptose:LPS heptosyltransferase